MTTATHPGMVSAYERFNQPKPEGDIDLVAEVRQILQESGLVQNAIEYFDTNRLIQDAIGKSSDVQRHLMNRYWSTQLAMVPNSTDIRYMLIPNGTILEWLKLFCSVIVPVLITHRLPKMLSVSF